MTMIPSRTSVYIAPAGGLKAAQNGFPAVCVARGWPLVLPRRSNGTI